jgi:F-box/WD-40 domain protein 7
VCSFKASSRFFEQLALYVLSFLEPRDLLNAAKTCQYWRILAEDNLLWREKCREEAIDEALVFGPKAKRKSFISKSTPWKSLFMCQMQIEQNWRSNTLRPPKVNVTFYFLIHCYSNHLVQILRGHDDHVITCLEFSGNRIVSGSDDNTLKVWSAITGRVSNCFFSLSQLFTI